MVPLLAQLISFEVYDSKNLIASAGAPPQEKRKKKRSKTKKKRLDPPLGPLAGKIMKAELPGMAGCK